MAHFVQFEKENYKTLITFIHLDFLGVSFLGVAMTLSSKHEDFKNDSGIGK